MSLFGFLGSLFGGNKQAKAADAAAKLQYDANMAGLAQTQHQYDDTKAMYAPVTSLLAPSAEHLGNLTGINGDTALNAEIARIMAGPRFKALMDNGRAEQMARASATGDLRGGNFQDATQRFGADTLSQEIGRQLGEYSGVVGLGTGAVGAVGNFGAQAVAQGNDLRNSGADALAQAKLVRGGIAARNWQNAGGLLDAGISSLLPGGGGIWKTLF